VKVTDPVALRKKLAQGVKHLICIWEVSTSSLGRDTYCISLLYILFARSLLEAGRDRTPADIFLP
jgi:hypothetical protein